MPLFTRLPPFPTCWRVGRFRRKRKGCVGGFGGIFPWGTYNGFGGQGLTQPSGQAAPRPTGHSPPVCGHVTPLPQQAGLHPQHLEWVQPSGGRFTHTCLSPASQPTHWCGGHVNPFPQKVTRSGRSTCLQVSWRAPRSWMSAMGPGGRCSCGRSAH